MKPTEILLAELADLARLRVLNAELLEALAKCSEQLTRLGYSANHADAAIAKAEEGAELGAGLA